MQSKLESLTEKTLDVGSGFVIGVLMYKFVVLPNDWLKYSPVMVTALFTLVSLARGYIWRRIFNRRHNGKPPIHVNSQ